MKIVRTGLVMVSVIATLNVGGVVHAASENLPWSDGGTGASNFSYFQVKQDLVCGGSGIAMRDDVKYGFNVASVVAVGGTVIGSGAGTVDVTTDGSDSIATHTETVGDLSVIVNYRFTDDNIARTLVTITNNGADVADLSVRFEYDHGDGYTIRSVDGGVWRNSGNWFSASEDDLPTDQFDNYHAVFHLPDGPGNPETMASVTNCAGNPVLSSSVDVTNLVYGYSVDIPAGQTRRILSFVGLAQTAVEVGAKAGSFASSPLTPGSGILSDLSAEDACTVVNWEFEVCGSGGGQPSYDIDIDISNYTRESDLPDTL